MSERLEAFLEQAKKNRDEHLKRIMDEAEELYADKPSKRRAERLIQLLYQTSDVWYHFSSVQGNVMKKLAIVNSLSSVNDPASSRGAPPIRPSTEHVSLR
jgi:phosphoribosyl-ATP pyrophosphohydrolase